MLGESSDLKAGPPHPPFTHGFLEAIWSYPVWAPKAGRSPRYPREGHCVPPRTVGQSCVSALRQGGGCSGLDPRAGLCPPPSDRAPRAGCIPLLAPGQDYLSL